MQVDSVVLIVQSFSYHVVVSAWMKEKNIVMNAHNAT